MNKRKCLYFLPYIKFLIFPFRLKYSIQKLTYRSTINMLNDLLYRFCFIHKHKSFFFIQLLLYWIRLKIVQIINYLNKFLKYLLKRFDCRDIAVWFYRNRLKMSPIVEFWKKYNYFIHFLLMLFMNCFFIFIIKVSWINSLKVKKQNSFFYYFS